MTSIDSIRDLHALVEDGRYSHALEVAQGVLAEPPSAWGPGEDAAARLVGIRCLLELDRPLEAFAWTDEYLALHRNDPEALVLRARAALRTDRIAMAEEALDAVAAAVTDATVARLRAEVALARGRNDEAVRATVQAIDAGSDAVAAWTLATVVSAVPGAVIDDLVDRLPLSVEDPAALGALVHGSTGGLHRLLDELWRRTPGHPLVAAVLRFAGSRLPVETALAWSARLRGVGHEGECPLLGVAADESRTARERIRAAAAAARAFSDSRAEPLLSLAVAALRADEVAEAFTETMELAPELIEAFVLASALDPRRCVIVAGCLERVGVGDFGLALLRHAADSGTSPAALSRIAATLPDAERDGLLRRARAADDARALVTLGAA